MSKTMLRIVAIVMIVLIVAFSGCTDGDEESAVVEPTEATPTATPDVVPEATPVEEMPAAPAAAPVEEKKTADATVGFTPKSSDRSPLEVPSGGCEGLDQSVLIRYDFDENGLIDSDELEKAKIGYEHNYEKQSDYEQILYAYEHNCPVDQV